MPVVIAAVVLGRSLVPMTRDAGATRLDPVGAGLSIAGLGALVWGIIETHERGWGDPLVLGAFVASVVVLGLFAAWELRREDPMLDLRLFAVRCCARPRGRARRPRRSRTRRASRPSPTRPRPWRRSGGAATASPSRASSNFGVSQAVGIR